MPRRALGVAALFLLLACTRGDDLTYAEQAETVCRQVNRHLAAIPVPTSSAGYGIWLERTVQENRRGAQRLRSLTPQANDAAAARELVRAGEAATEGLEAWVHAHRAGDEKAQRRAERAIERVRARYTAAAQALGLQACIPPSPVATGR